MLYFLFNRALIQTASGVHEWVTNCECGQKEFAAAMTDFIKSKDPIGPVYVCVGHIEIDPVLHRPHVMTMEFNVIDPQLGLLGIDFTACDKLEELIKVEVAHLWHKEWYEIDSDFLARVEAEHETDLEDAERRSHFAGSRGVI